MSMGALSRIGLTEIPATDPVVEVYHHVLRDGGLATGALDSAASQLGLPLRDVFSAVMRLVELHLLRTDGDQLVLTDPQVATSLVVSPIERAIYQQRELADQLRNRIETISRPRDGGVVSAIDSFIGVAEVSGLLKLAADACQDDVVVLRPSGEGATDLDRLFDGCLGALTSSNVRLIYPHRSRAGFASRARAKRLVEDGAQIRTVSHVPQACIVFGRSLAIVLGTSDEGTSADTAAPTAQRVRDVSVVRCLVDMFDQLWEGAAPFVTDEAGYAEDVTDDLQRCIARMMAEGLTDEVVARRLGMSVRTCRRHIAALLRNLDSVSRFQAGVQAARMMAEEGPLGAVS